MTTSKVHTPPQPLESYCSVCDAPAEVDCGHDAHRYLDPIEYEPTDLGWLVPEHERERWENPVTVERSVMPVKPIQRLIVELEAFVDIDQPLERLLRSTYELNPRRVSALVEQALDGHKAGTLRSPGGYLYSRLSKVANNRPQIHTPARSLEDEDPRPPGWDT